MHFKSQTVFLIWEWAMWGLEVRDRHEEGGMGHIMWLFGWFSFTSPASPGGTFLSPAFKSFNLTLFLLLFFFISPELNVFTDIYELSESLLGVNLRALHRQLVPFIIKEKNKCLTQSFLPPKTDSTFTHTSFLEAQLSFIGHSLKRRHTQTAIPLQNIRVGADCHHLRYHTGY